MDRDNRRFMGAASVVQGNGPFAHIAAFKANTIMDRQIRENADLDLVPYETRWSFDTWPSLTGGDPEIHAVVRVRFQDRHHSRGNPWTVAA